MKNQIKNTMNKLIAFAVLATILTGFVFAKAPNGEMKDRDQIAEMLRKRENMEAIIKRNDTDKIASVKNGTAVLSNQENFTIGKDFAIAIFDSKSLENNEDALYYTIVDLVYLIDQLEGQPEAAELQKTLKKVVRETGTAIEISKEIETISKTYLNRQKADQKWYLNAGVTAMNLSISTYLGKDLEIKKGLSEMQALIKTAPNGTPKEVIDSMNVLAKYVTKTSYTEQDYMAIYEGVGQVINTVSA